MNCNYFLYKPNDQLILVTECFKDGLYYSVDWIVKDNVIERINEKVDCKFIKNEVMVNDNVIKVNLKCSVNFKNGNTITFDVNKEFEKIYKSKYDCFDKLDDEFTIKYIKDLIDSNNLSRKPVFVFDNCEDIFKLSRAIEKKRGDSKHSQYTQKMSLEECLEYANSFFKEFNIDVDVYELVHNKTIRFIDKKKLGEDGFSYFDEKTNKKLIDVFKSENFLMLAVLVHEVMHYLNQPEDGKRNFSSNYLTEVVSYSIELILADKFLDEKYGIDAKVVLNNTSNALFNCAFSLYSPLLSLCIYKKNNGIITKEKIEESIKFEQFKIEMRDFIKKRNTIERSVWYLLGYFLSIYNYIEYKDDSSYVERIKELNDSINEKSFDECLKIMNINGLEDIFSKCLDSIDKYNSIISKNLDVKASK